MALVGLDRQSRRAWIEQFKNFVSGGCVEALVFSAQLDRRYSDVKAQRMAELIPASVLAQGF